MSSNIPSVVKFDNVFSVEKMDSLNSPEDPPYPGMNRNDSGKFTVSNSNVNHLGDHLISQKHNFAAKYLNSSLCHHNSLWPEATLFFKSQKGYSWPDTT